VEDAGLCWTAIADQSDNGRSSPKTKKIRRRRSSKKGTGVCEEGRKKNTTKNVQRRAHDGHRRREGEPDGSCKLHRGPTTGGHPALRTGYK